MPARFSASGLHYPRLRAAPACLFLILVLMGVSLAMSGCAGRPDLSGRVSEAHSDLPWPRLIHISSDLTETGAGTGDTDNQSPATQLAARARALRARAAALSHSPVLTTPERRNLLLAIDRHF